MPPAPPASLEWAHPLVREWFVERFATPTEPQEQGWPHILAGHTTLISAPTGSGKTLAAFFACIDRLVRKALAGDLQDRTEVLYISPLKALGNDIQKNLEIPLGEILQRAGERGLLMPEIRTAVRTGDTLMHERRAMLKRPPHILVTTPESFYILLTAERSRAILRDVETVIVDEIHAVADDKRGAHLTLSLERLEALTACPPVRIGLSATQRPIEQVAEFLTGAGRPAPAIVNIGHKRHLDLAVEVPASPLGPVASNEMWDEIYDRIAELVRHHRSTLVFVNTRRLAERVAHQLAERLGEDVVAAHHGSLARKLRLAAEKKLKSGEARVLVATASLELGIDIGFVDLVCHISSPRSIAVTLQRIGRAGHWRGAVPKGRIFATTRDELMECAALVRAIRHGDLDRIIMPEAPLDILAQQIVAICAAGDRSAAVLAVQLRSERPQDSRPEPGATAETGWPEDELFHLVRRAYPYRDLPRALFDEILTMLSEGIAARRGRYGAYLFRDRVHGRLRARRGARLAAITSGGAIPENALYTVVAEPEGTVVGTVDEDFAVESNKGDIMLLGNTSWQIRRIEGASGRMLVEDAHGAPPSVPFWRGEAPARTSELSEHVAELRKNISDMLPRTSPIGISQNQPEVAETVRWLKEECCLDDSGAEQAIEYVIQGRAVLGDVPTQKTIIAERFFDEGGGMQLVIHAPFGGRINKAWGLALRKRFCRSFNFELQAAATDDGLNIALAEQHSFPLADVFNFLDAETVQPVIEQAVLTGSPIFGTRWRWDAMRSLALLRFQGGKKLPLQIQRMRSDDLLASVFPDVAACQENVTGDIQIPDHPLVREVMKDVLTEAMDIDGLRAVLRGIEDGSIRCLAVDTPVPSQFSHEILNANPYAYLDDAPLEERRARAVQMRRLLPESVLEEVGKLDPVAIAQVREEAWPDVRDADELHDVLQTLIAVPEECVGTGPPGPSNECVGTGAPSAGSGQALARAGVPEARLWSSYFGGLASSGRAARATLDGKGFWFSAERAQTFAQIYPAARFETALPKLDVSVPSRDDALLQMITGWMGHLGPTNSAELAQTLSLPQSEIDKALLRLEATGAILRGNFTGGSRHGGAPARGWSSDHGGFLARSSESTNAPLLSQEPAPAQGSLPPQESVPPQEPLPSQRSLPSHLLSEGHGFSRAESTAISSRALAPEVEWCDRRLLARIHRLTLGTLRKQVEPVTAAQFMRWLLRWQHVAPGTQVLGERGTLQILQQLQGFEIPASAWEPQVLARRIAGYDPKALDQLCLTGAVGWGRLSPHPATLEDSAEGKRRVIPTSVAPITFYVREEADWLPPHTDHQDGRGLSHAARQVLEFLRQRGASFFADIVRGTGKLKAEVETALWELVAAGLVTADGFDNLRSLIDPKRRSGHGSGRMNRPRHSSGRWALLHTGEALERTRQVEAGCWMLLRRYGVVFRDLLAREAIVPKWRELAIAFRRLEDRGEVRGGRFVSGFLGEQFALPVAVESLRAMRKIEPAGETITLSAADPLNLVGIIVPGDRVPAISGKTVSFRDGVAVVPAESSAHAATGD